MSDWVEEKFNALPPKKTTTGFGRMLAIVIALALVISGLVLAVRHLNQVFSGATEAGCSITIGSQRHHLDPEQSYHAAIISAEAQRRGLSEHEIVIALATALQESKLRNIDYGDQAGPDSRGLFQQRPSQGWGTTAQIMDPWYAAGRFYQELVKVPGYRSLSVTQAAQTVQRSAHPEAYAKHEQRARAFAHAFSDADITSMRCHFPEEAAKLSATRRDRDISRFLRAVHSNDAALKRNKHRFSFQLSHPDRTKMLARWLSASGAYHGWRHMSYVNLKWDPAESWHQSAKDAPAAINPIFLNAELGTGKK